MDGLSRFERNHPHLQRPGANEFHVIWVKQDRPSGWVIQARQQRATLLLSGLLPIHRERRLYLL